MKFIKLSTSYMLKNFLYLILMAIVPAVFLGSLISPFKIIEFANTYSITPILSFGTIFNGIASVEFLNILFLIIGIILTSIFASGILGQMENHMRSGKLNFDATKDYVNSNILVVVANFVALFIVGYIIMFLTSGILFLMHILLSGINTSPTVLNMVVSSIILSIIFIVYALISSVIFVNIPNMMINGSQFKFSLGTSIKLHQKNSFDLILAVLLPFIVIIPFVSFFTGTDAIVFVNIFGMLMLIMYYTSLAMTSYFELTKTTRQDNRRKYYYK